MELTNSVIINAVNSILSSIGDAPVSSIEDPRNINVVNAIKTLKEVSREEQARGWEFNTVPSYTLNSDINEKRIKWSSSYLSVVPTTGDRLIQREGYAFNFSKQTFTFNSDIKAEVVLELEVDELPEAFRSYVIAKCCFKFQTEFLGDPQLAQLHKLKVDETWANFMRYDLEMGGYSIMSNPKIMEIARS